MSSECLHEDVDLSPAPHGQLRPPATVFALSLQSLTMKVLHHHLAANTVRCGINTKPMASGVPPGVNPPSELQMSRRVSLCSPGRSGVFIFSRVTSGQRGLRLVASPPPPPPPAPPPAGPRQPRLIAHTNDPG